MKKIGLLLTFIGILQLNACSPNTTEAGTTTETTSGEIEAPEASATDQAETATVAPDSIAIIAADSATLKK